MRTIISGPVTLEDIEDAAIFGIDPSEFITNGESKPPEGTGLFTTVMKLDPMLPGPAGVHQKDWGMCLAAEAVIIHGQNDHLAYVARRNDLLVYHT